MDQYRIIPDPRSTWFGQGGYIVQRLIFGKWLDAGWHKTLEDAQAVVDGNMERQEMWAHRFDKKEVTNA